MDQTDARLLAWRLLDELDGDPRGRLDADDPLLRGIPRRDRQLAREIALGVLRHESCYHDLGQRFLSKPAADGQLLRLLAIGAHQLFACDRIPARAAVHTTVELAKHINRRYGGVVNAVLRRLSTYRREPADPRLPPPLARIAAEILPTNPARRYSLPPALLVDLPPLPDGDDSHLAWFCHLPPLCSRDRGSEPVAHPAIIRREGRWAWWKDPAAALDGPVAAGLCAIQDRAQGHAIALAETLGGELVCDCCAAPGGKSLALRDLGCRVIAADNAANKSGLLQRTLGPGRIVIQDSRQPGLSPAAFDLVVVDAPCSNSGVFGRRPEAKRRYHDDHLTSLRRLQTDLLAAATKLVAADGRLLYCTCSLGRSENHDIVAALDGWQAVAEHIAWPDAWQQGGYAALLRRS